MTEQQWEKKLKISTTGRKASHADAYRYPYEPTPYCVLERIADSGIVTEECVLVDYGCGRGRVGFFLHHQTGCRTIGVEYDPEIYTQAIDNHQACGSPGGVSFVCMKAEQFCADEGDVFYFFNPFSLEVLQSVFGRILESYYSKPRDINLVFYYPSDTYRSWLMTQKELLFIRELDCKDLFDGKNPRETVLIFEMR